VAEAVAPRVRGGNTQYGYTEQSENRIHRLGGQIPIEETMFEVHDESSVFNPEAVRDYMSRVRPVYTAPSPEPSASDYATFEIQLAASRRDQISEEATARREALIARTTELSRRSYRRTNNNEPGFWIPSEE